MNVPRGRWLAEFLLIVVGVLAALWVDDWREARSDRALEQHLLLGIRDDLARDLSDVRSAMVAAEGRAAAADELLALIGDPETGVVWPTSWLSGVSPDLSRWLEVARSQYPTGSISAQRALHMVGAGGATQRLDLSDATFSEAKASGQLDVIRDDELRDLIANYYFEAGRFGNTTDNRIDAHAQHFRLVLAEAGLSPTGGASDRSVLAAFRENRRLIAELKNLRDFALSQRGFHDVVMVSAEAMLARLDERVVAQPGQPFE